jgi:hypothetical protein
MYQALGKDTINAEIISHLSMAKRGFKTKNCLLEIVNNILYKLKTGCQWHKRCIAPPIGGSALEKNIFKEQLNRGLKLLPYLCC